MAICEITENLNIIPCGGMFEAFNRRMNHNQGLRLANYYNLDTDAHSYDCIILKNGAKDRGLTLNFCPFCGVNIETHTMTKGDKS